MTRYTPMHPTIISLTEEVQQLEGQVNAEHARNARPAARKSAATEEEQRGPEIALPEIDSSDFLIAELQLETERINRDIASVDEVKRQVLSKMALYQSRINPPAELAQQLSALNRDYENAKLQYTDVSYRKNRSGLASQADTSEDSQVFKIIDKANLPRYSTGISRRMIVAGGCLAGLLLGCGAAFGRDLMDPSLHDEREASTELKMPILVSLPEVASEEKKKPAKKRREDRLAILDLQPEKTLGSEFQLLNAERLIREVVGNPMTIAGEQFRLLRAKLSAIQKTVGLKSLIVTSAIPNEGKTFSATCLAGIMAQEPGKRVLLIDGDLRTGNAGRVLGIGRGRIGLSDHLRDGICNNAELLQQSILRCSDSNWYFLPAGTPAKNPGELLISPEFEALIRLVQDQFDWVIVDSSPVLVLADTNSIAPICGATLLIMCADKTSVALVKDAVARLGPERICGLVMNRVQHMKAKQYYRSYYHKQTISS